MSDEMNPLIPAAYDITWSIVGALVLAFTVIALTSLIRSGQRLSPLPAAIWAVVVLAIPILGPIAWLAIGRRSAVSDVAVNGRRGPDALRN